MQGGTESQHHQVGTPADDQAHHGQRPEDRTQQSGHVDALFYEAVPATVRPNGPSRPCISAARLPFRSQATVFVTERLQRRLATARRAQRGSGPVTSSRSSSAAQAVIEPSYTATSDRPASAKACATPVAAIPPPQ